MVLSVREGEVPSLLAHHVAFLAQACQHLWLVRFNDVYREFAYANHAVHPSPLLP